jgi:hypothetical protein
MSPNKFVETVRAIIALFIAPTTFFAIISIPALLQIPYWMKVAQIRRSLVDALNNDVSLEQINAKLNILVQEYKDFAC